MKISEAVDKFNNGKIKSIAQRAFSSYLFPFVTAAVTVLFVGVGLEAVVAWYLCLCLVGITLCCDDLSPAICPLVFMQEASGAILHVVIAGVIVCIVGIYRLVLSIIKHKFKITSAFVCLCVYAVALVFNGAFSSSLCAMDTLFALFIGGIALLVFACFSCNVCGGDRTYKRIAYVFLALCLALAVQLLIAYLTLGVIENGVIVRAKIAFSWGTYNQFGMLITVCVPAWFYLALKSKYGFAYLFGVPFNLFVAFMSASRQAMLSSLLLAVICAVWYLIAAKKRQKLYGGAVMLAFLAAVVIILCVNKDKLLHAFNEVIYNFVSGSGRTQIWIDGLNGFLHNPVFGNGFYGMTDGGIVPFLCHNTVVQLLYGCGFVGFAAYTVHRAQTVFSLVKNPSGNRLFVALTVCGILFTSLLDNHIFYGFPLLIYASLFGVFTHAEGENDMASQVNNRTAHINDGEENSNEEVDV